MENERPSYMVDIVQEIIQNAREDRTRLVRVADKLAAVMDAPVVRDAEGEAAPEIALTVAEEMAKVTDSLTRVNQQLVDLLKVTARPKNPNGRPSVQETEGIYERIQEQDQYVGP